MGTSKTRLMSETIRKFNVNASEFTTWLKWDKSLTAIQKEILKKLHHYRKEVNAINQDTLTKSINVRYGFKVRPQRFDRKQIRDVIAELRVMGALICSKGGVGGGYWVAENREQMKKSIKSQYTKRALNMLWKARVQRDATIEIFGGQRVFDMDLERILDEIKYINPEERD